METRFGGTAMPPRRCTSWAAEASAVVTGMLRVTAGQRGSGEALLPGPTTCSQGTRRRAGRRLGPAAVRADPAVRGAGRTHSASATGGRADGRPRPGDRRTGTRLAASSRPGPAWARHRPRTTDRHSRVPRRGPAGPLARGRSRRASAPGCQRCCAGTPTRTRGRTRRSTTPPPGSAIPTWALVWRPSWPLRGPAGRARPGLRRRARRVHPRRPDREPARVCLCTWRTCCPTWSCRWPARRRCCCSSSTG